MDIETDIFAETTYGKLALQKIGSVSKCFRLFSAGWLGNKPKDWDVMEVKGAEFREAKTGKNKGKLSILLPDTTRIVYVTRSEIQSYKAGNC